MEQTSRDLAKIGEAGPERDEGRQAGTDGGQAPNGRDEPPYLGLTAYEEADAGRFFGREDITELIAFLAEQRSDLPLMLVGAAGSGKSSLLRAGLLPRLRAAADELALAYPEVTGRGPVELHDLAAGGVTAAAARVAELLRSAGAAPGAWGAGSVAGAWGGAAHLPPAVLVDQFEAVFTDAASDAERTSLIAGLCDLARSTLVVIALRAECYGQVLGHPVLRRALQERNVLLGPMSAVQVRRVVEEPARLAGRDVDEGLADAVLADLALDGAAPAAADPADRPDVEWTDAVQGDDAAGRPDADGQAHEPGALPRLSYALLAAWRQADGGPLTATAYQAGGGVAEALPRAAEHAYGNLSHGQQRLARRLLLRLVHLADGQPPRPVAVPLSELRESGAGARADIGRVLGALAGERLITLEDGRALITHDVLLTAWPRLRGWLAGEARGQLPAAEPDATAGDGKQARTRAQASVAAVAAATADEPAATAGPAGGADAGTGADAPAAAREAAGTTASLGRDRRRVRRLRGLVAALVVLVLAAGGLAGYEFTTKQRALTASQAATASGQAADSRAVAFIADRKRGADPAVAAQLAAAAYQLSPTAQATASLLDAASAPAVARIVDAAGDVRVVSVSPDGKLLVAAGPDGSLRLWNITAPGRPVAAGTLPAAGGRVDAAAFSPDGKTLATAGPRGVQLWQVAGTTPPVTAIGQPLTGAAADAVAFSPDGKSLATGTADGTVRQWTVTDPAHPAADGKPLSASGARPVTAVAFGAGVLAAGSSSGTVTLWALAGAAAPARFHDALNLGGGPVSAVAFSPDGKTLAAAGSGSQAGLWTVRTGTGKKHKGTEAVPDGMLPGLSHGTDGIAFSPDGASLAAANPGAATGAGASVLVWSLATRELTATVPQPQAVTSVAWAGPAELAASSASGTVSLIALPVPALSAGNLPASVAYDPDGTTIAVGGTSVQLWDTARHTLLAGHPLPAGTTVNATAFTAQAGQQAVAVAVALSDGTVALLSGHDLTPLSPPFPVTAAKGAATAVAFSSDGKLLATGAADGTIRLYDASDPAHPRRLAAGSAPGGAVAGVALAADGTMIATAGADGAVRLWQAGHPADGGPMTLTSAGPGLSGPAGDVNALAFSPDGSKLAADAARTVRLWDVRQPGHPVPLGVPLSGPSGAVLSVAFNPAGTSLAAGTADGSTWLWNVTAAAHPALVADLAAAGGRVSGIAFSPSGGQLAAVNGNGVHLWTTSPAAALSGICASLGQPLTPAEWAGSVPGVAYHAPCQGG